MRARWIVLALILGSASIASAQGGVGLFDSPSCATIANPVTGATWCLQTAVPYSLLVWDGAVFSQPALSGPFAPTTFGANGVLYGNGTGPILVTSQGGANTILVANAGAPFFSSTATIGGLTTTNQAALVLNPYGSSGGNTGELRLLELAANGTEYVGWKAPDAITTSVLFKMPATPGTNGQCFVTDGATPVATISFGACSGGGTGITSLNALVGAVQTFTNDTNVQISSAGSAHAIVWASTLAVARGGTGAGTFTANGALLGNGTSAFQVTAAGAADTTLRVPGGGGTPAFGALDVSKAAAITGLVVAANLGSGTPDATVFLRGDRTWALPTASAVTNYGFNTNFEIWGAGISSVPTSWALSSCSAVSKNTAAGQFKIGAAAMNLTRSAGACLAFQDVVTAYGPVDYWKSQTVTLGGWVRCTLAARGFLEIFDGSSTATSSAHSGGSTFEFLSVPMSLGAGATKVEIRAKISGGSATCQFDGLILTTGASVSAWQPDAWRGRTSALGTVLTPPGTGTQYTAVITGPTSTTEGDNQAPMPFHGVLRFLRVRSGTSSVFTSSGVTVRVGGVSSALTTTFTQGGVTTSDLVDDVEVQAGALVSIQHVYSAITLVNPAGYVTLELEEVP
jgi:hypothetical protein